MSWSDKMARASIAAALLMSGCSAVVGAPQGITVDCERQDMCIGLNAQHTIDVFRYEWELDTERPLSITYVENGSLAKPTDTGVTIDCKTILATSDKALLHELLHVRFCREFNDPDDGHHQSPSGRWRYSHTLLLELLEVELTASEL